MEYGNQASLTNKINENNRKENCKKQNNALNSN